MMDTREAVARALAPEIIADGPYDAVPIDEIFTRPRYLFLKQQCERATDAAIAAHLKALEDAGYVVAKAEPTDEMLDAGIKAICKHIELHDGEAFISLASSHESYRAMIAASPQPVADHPADQRGGE